MSDSIELDLAPLPDWVGHVAVFDLETTGLNLKEARIVTAATAELDGDGFLMGEARQWLVNPGIDIPIEASNVHGITTQIAKAEGTDSKAAVVEILQSLKTFFDRGIPVVAYNAPYDFTILHFESLRHNLEPLVDPKPILDPLVIDKHVDQYRKGKRTLEAGCLNYGVKLDNAHNAAADAIAAGRLAQAIVSRHLTKLPSELLALHESQVSWSAKQDSSYEQFRQKTQPDFSVKLGWPLKL